MALTLSYFLYLAQYAIALTMAATPDWDRLGTRVSRLAMKWVRQRCQPAPVNTAAMAFFRP